MKLRFGEHPEYSSLMQLQVCQFGLWYIIEGTTVHSMNDKGKESILQEYRIKLGL